MKVIITTFTDPMMGLSYECEPLTDIEIVNVHHGWFIKKKGYYE